MSALRTITEAELALHNSYTDLWVAIENKVYNLTEFQMEHPGGSDILVEVAGRDATDEFEVGIAWFTKCLLIVWRKSK